MTRSNCNTPIDDAALMDRVIRCMGSGYYAANTDLLIVAPHTHGDHVNPITIGVLMNSYGYGVEAVQYHTDGLYTMLSPGNMGTSSPPWGDCTNCSNLSGACVDTDKDMSEDSCARGGPFNLMQLTSSGAWTCGSTGTPPPVKILLDNSVWSETMSTGGVQLQLIRRGRHGCCMCSSPSTCWNTSFPNVKGVGNLDLVINSGATDAEKIVVLGSGANPSSSGDPDCNGYSNVCAFYQSYGRVIAAHGNLQP